MLLSSLYYNIEKIAYSRKFQCILSRVHFSYLKKNTKKSKEKGIAEIRGRSISQEKGKVMIKRALQIVSKKKERKKKHFSFNVCD